MEFPVDQYGVPLSDDLVFNACIRNQVMLDDSGNPYNCKRYHPEDNIHWIHPLGVGFTYPPLELPEGWIAVTVVTEVPVEETPADPPEEEELIPETPVEEEPNPETPVEEEPNPETPVEPAAEEPVSEETPEVIIDVPPADTPPEESVPDETPSEEIPASTEETPAEPAPAEDPPVQE